MFALEVKQLMPNAELDRRVLPSNEVFMTMYDRDGAQDGKVLFTNYIDPTQRDPLEDTEAQEVRTFEAVTPDRDLILKTLEDRGLALSHPEGPTAATTGPCAHDILFGDDSDMMNPYIMLNQLSNIPKASMTKADLFACCLFANQMTMDSYAFNALQKFVKWLVPTHQAPGMAEDSDEENAKDDDFDITNMAAVFTGYDWPALVDCLLHSYENDDDDRRRISALEFVAGTFSLYMETPEDLRASLGIDLHGLLKAAIQFMINSAFDVTPIQSRRATQIIRAVQELDGGPELLETLPVLKAGLRLIMNVKNQVNDAKNPFGLPLPADMAWVRRPTDSNNDLNVIAELIGSGNVKCIPNKQMYQLLLPGLTWMAGLSTEAKPQGLYDVPRKVAKETIKKLNDKFKGGRRTRKGARGRGRG